MLKPLNPESGPSLCWSSSSNHPVIRPIVCNCNWLNDRQSSHKSRCACCWKNPCSPGNKNSSKKAAVVLWLVWGVSNVPCVYINLCSKSVSETRACLFSCCDSVFFLSSSVGSTKIRRLGINRSKQQVVSGTRIISGGHWGAEGLLLKMHTGPSSTEMTFQKLKKQTGAGSTELTFPKREKCW